MNFIGSLKRRLLLGLPQTLLCLIGICAFVSSAWSQGPQGAQVPLPDGPEKQTVATVCTACHTTDRIVSQQNTRQEWLARVRRMIANGAQLPENKIEAVTDYLAKSFPPAPGGPVPKTADGKPDLSGTWVAQPGGGGVLGASAGYMDTLKVTPWGEDKIVWNREPTESKVPLAGNHVGEDYSQAMKMQYRPRRDQDPWFNCYPVGLVRLGPPTRMNGAGPGVQIIQTPGMVTIVYESRNAVRYIYTDGREHPTSNLQVTWMGNSIGKWEGDTLVVDTIGLRDESWLDTVGHEHSRQLHVVERIRRTDGGTLEYQRTLNDPIAFEGTFEDHVTLKSNPRYLWKQNLDDDCTQYMIRKPGFGEGLGGLLGIGDHP